MSGELFQIWVFLARSPLLWLTVTVLVYLAAVWVHRRSGSNMLVNPMLLAVGALVVILTLTETPYPDYFEGAKFVHFLIGPATVLLAVPLYSQIARLKRMWLPLGMALVAGSATAIGSAIAIGSALGASRETLYSIAPKSATTPIAMAVAEQAGGLPALAAMATAVTAISGTMMARPIFDLLGLRDPAVRGFSAGLTAHAIGVARAIQVNDVAGAFAALALGLNGVATALLMPLLVRALQAML